MATERTARFPLKSSDRVLIGTGPELLWTAGIGLDLGSLAGGPAFAKAAFVDVAIGCVLAVGGLVLRPMGIIGDSANERRIALVRALLQLAALALFWVMLWARHGVFADVTARAPSFMPGLVALGCLVAARLVASPAAARMPAIQRR